jgi:hypothetical protein
MNGFTNFSVSSVGFDYAKNSAVYAARAVAHRGDGCLETSPVATKEEAQALADKLNAGDKSIQTGYFSGY